MDVALPVKLFDSMAAGRPLVVTPGVETAGSRAAWRGSVDRRRRSASTTWPRAPAAHDEALTRGSAPAPDRRRTRIDWPIVGDRIADEVFRRGESAPAGARRLSDA